MRAIRYIYGPKLATQKAFLAGNDIIMLRFNHKDEISAINKVIKMAKSEKIKSRRINKSVKRIINLKQKYQINDNEVIGCNIDEVNSRIENIKKQVDKL